MKQIQLLHGQGYRLCSSGNPDRRFTLPGNRHQKVLSGYWQTDIHKTDRKPETYQFFRSSSRFSAPGGSGSSSGLRCRICHVANEWLHRPVVPVIFFLLMFLLAHAPSPAQTGFGARGLAMGGTGFLTAGDAWAVFNNPSALPDSGTTVSFSGIRYFGMSELNEAAAAVAVGFNRVRLGAGAASFGFGMYRESGFHLGMMIPWRPGSTGQGNAAPAWAGSSASGPVLTGSGSAGPGLAAAGWAGTGLAGTRAKARPGSGAVGLAAEFRHIAIERYGSASAILLNAGVTFHPTANIALAATLGNATGSAIGRSRDPLPVVSSVGVSWQTLDNLNLVTAAVKDNRFPLSWRMGAEYTPVRAIAFRGGAMTGPEQFNLGLAVNLSGFTAAFAALNHLELGWTTTIELTMRF
jgi:hypothetical protein